MVLKSAAVLSCLLPARLAFGSNRPDSPSRTRDHEKRARVNLGDPEFDPFQGNPLPPHRKTDPCSPSDRPDCLRARANTAPSDLPSPLLMPNGGIGESPNPLHRSLAPPVRQKRSSFTTFFAFSSKRRSSHGAPVVHLPKLQQDLLVPPHAVHAKWVSDSAQSDVQLISPTALPSPLRADDEEYYYSYHASSSPTPSPHPDVTNRSPSKQLFLQRHDLTGNPDLDSSLSSPADSHPSHAQIWHPYAYSTPLYPKPYPRAVDTVPRLRHASSQPFQNHLQNSRPNVEHEPLSQPEQPELKTSMSTPNLVSGSLPLRPRSILRKKPSTRAKERWLSAESWWDALFSPSPRFKVKRAPRPGQVTESILNTPISSPVRAGSSRNLGVTFPAISPVRPRAVSIASATSSTKPTVHSLARSRSAVDLSGGPSTSATARAGFEPALETLVDQPTPPPEQLSGNESELALPDPPISLEQVLTEGEVFEHQRALWKQQASKSLGNKHTRSFSRARSKSLGERHARLGRHAPESSKAQLNLEFLAARTLLGSQSTMPIVHVTKPSSSSSHSKAYSHSHSQSAYSYTHSSHSRAYSHSHSHSHSLTTSNSSKSSRHNPPRTHSRNGSWGKTALLKAGALCGFAQDDPYTTDDKVPSSSRVDVQGTIVIGHSTNADQVPVDVDKVSPSPSDPGEVGIAISPSPALDGSFNPAPSRQESVHDHRWSSKHTHKSSEYAGPHPSAIDSNLPSFGAASDVSLRHRLPPRAIHPLITPIVHPYRSATAQSGPVGNNGSPVSKVTVTGDKEATEPSVARSPYLSLSHADFEQYGVGEALVYASFPRPQGVPETKQADMASESSPTTELPSPLEQSTDVSHSEGRDSSSLAMQSVPSLTSSTIQMVMSAFNSPDDLDEFQDLFYKPHSAGASLRREPSIPVNQVPTDVRSSASSSPLTHLVRKLSEEVNSLRDPSRTPSDPTPIPGSESQEHRLNEVGTKFVFMDVARLSSSPAPMGSSSQLQLPIQEGSESLAPPILAIPEDVHSSYTSSVLESPLEDQDNDTFGYPVKHGQLEVATAPTPIQSPMRTSTHLSIQEDESDEPESAFSSPVTKRFGVVSVDAVRASYLTTSDLSRMSGLSDFPLPPGARPVSILHPYDEATPPSSSSDSHDPSDEVTETGHREQHADTDGEDDETSGDVKETLRALRTPRVASYQSRSTFGGSDDMDYITELHQAGP